MHNKIRFFGYKSKGKIDVVSNIQISSVKMPTDANIDLNVYESNVAIGSTEGHEYILENRYALLSTLTVHRDNQGIRGLNIKLSNGQGKNAGQLIDSSPIVLAFDDCQIKSITVYYGNNHWGRNMVKGMKFDTTKGVREAYCTGFTEEDMGRLPVGSGWCAGVFGRAGQTMNALGLAMLKVPAHYTDSDVDLNVYESNIAIGNAAGDNYIVENRSALLSTLTVHRDTSGIRGLEIKLNNGEGRAVGQLIDSSPVVLAFDECQITSIAVYYGTNYYGSNMLKGMKIDTINGVREAYCLGFTEEDMGRLPVGSGWCAGAFGWAGETVDSLGFAMLTVSPK